MTYYRRLLDCLGAFRMEFSTGLNSLKSYLTMNNGEMLFRQFYSGYSPCISLLVLRIKQK